MLPTARLRLCPLHRSPLTTHGAVSFARRQHGVLACFHSSTRCASTSALRDAIAAAVQRGPPATGPTAAVKVDTPLGSLLETMVRAGARYGRCTGMRSLSPPPPTTIICRCSCGAQ